MMTEQHLNFWSVILGAALATIGGFLSQEYAAWRDRQRRRKLLKTFLRHIILQMNGIFTRLVDTYERTNVASVLYLAELENTKAGYDRNSDWIVLFDDELRQNIFDYFNGEQLSRFIIRSMISLAGQPNFTREHTDQQIGIHVRKISDLRVLGERILQNLAG